MLERDWEGCFYLQFNGAGAGTEENHANTKYGCIRTCIIKTFHWLQGLHGDVGKLIHSGTTSHLLLEKDAMKGC